ncbi:winged helix-turn-helix transcriptional regulator [Nocardiopsis sp. NPDC006938]|uniref:winged helix-turn-helix transcriptional regulator n=1 Tax=Nocardiopsis sp. NPDC006938 TaxID=3364337 RepID=UPI0036B20855
MLQSVHDEEPIEHLPVPGGRSGCPLNMTVELLGDRWSLIVLRDIVFGGHRHFRELLGNSLEGIASNILSSRLSKLVNAGLLSRHDDPSHRQKIEYRLTKPAIELIPVLAQLGQWGTRWLPTAPELAIRAQILADGGPQLWNRFMDELRDVHLHEMAPPADSVLTMLSRAHQRAVEASSGR